MASAYDLPWTQLRHEGYCDAVKKMHYDIARSKMRRLDPTDRFINSLPKDFRAEIKQYYKLEETSSLPLKFITVSLGTDHDELFWQSALNRCLRKCYVGDYWFVLEYGAKTNNPHYHIIIQSTVKTLHDSRIVAEWSKIFNIEKNFIDVKAMPREHLKRSLNYISKQGDVKSSKKNNSTI